MTIDAVKEKMGEEDEERFSAWDFLMQMIHEGFVGTIPMDLLEKFPGRWFQVTGVATYLIVFGCYIAFFITSYMDGLNATFISLDENAGDCHTVGKPLTGTYLASSEGEWEGSSAFKYTEAMYEFTFNNLQVDDQEFADMISVDFALDGIGAFTAKNDIATNMLVWMHHRKQLVQNDGKLQKMELVSRPSSVFKRSTSSAGIYVGPQITGGAALSCSSQYTSFDTQSAILAITLPTTGDCAAFGSLFEGVVQVDGDVIRAQVALNPFSTVAAINRNITSVDQLEQLYIATSFVVQGKLVNVSAMYDPAFQDSDEFYCVDLRSISTADNMRDMCCIDAGGVLLMPVLAHADEHCASCNRDASAAEIPCDYVGMLPFYVFIPEYAGDYAAQTAEFVSILTAASVTELKIAASRMFLTGDSAYFDELCPKCAFMWIYMGDDNPTISPYRRVLQTGLHCVDSVSSPAFAALAANPPTVLVENYYVCRSTTYNNIINAVGLSFGNTSIFAVCFLAFFLPGLYYLTKAADSHQKRRRRYKLAQISPRGQVRAYTTSEISLQRLQKIDAVCQHRVQYLATGRVDESTIRYFNSCFDQSEEGASAETPVPSQQQEP